MLPMPSNADSSHAEGDMGTLNRHGYVELIKGDLEVLNQLPYSMEREHIRQVLEYSVKAIYDEQCKCGRLRVDDHRESNRD